MSVNHRYTEGEGGGREGVTLVIETPLVTDPDMIDMWSLFWSQVRQPSPALISDLNQLGGEHFTFSGRFWFREHFMIIVERLRETDRERETGTDSWHVVLDDNLNRQ